MTADPLALLSAATAALAAMLLVPSPARSTRRLGPVPAGHGPGPRTLLVAGILTAALAAAVWAAAAGAGPEGVVLLAAALITAGIVLRLVSLHCRTATARTAREDVAHACSVLASQVRVGQVPAAALRSAAEDCPVLQQACDVQRLGGDVPSLWREQSGRPGCAGLRDLARTWRVSEQTGAPMADGLERVAEALRADQQVRAMVGGELAAPRATGKIMAVLPFCGLGLGYVIGGDPLAFLLDGPLGWACLLLGMTLAGAGVLWIDGLARSAGEDD